MSRPGDGKDAGSADQLIAEQCGQELDHRRQGDHVDGIRGIGPLDSGVISLVLTAVGQGCGEPIELLFDDLNLMRREEIRDYDIALDLQMPDPLGSAE